METTSDPFMARWRGLFRVFAGPAGADGVWDSDRHQIFLWASGEQGSETDVRTFHGSAGLHMFVTLLADIKADPALEKLYDRVRREQGVTRVEIWHQRLGDQEVVMRLIEGHDLDAAFTNFAQEGRDLDRRISSAARVALDESATTRSQAELIVDWRA
jgi:hypothetical protein